MTISYLVTLQKRFEIDSEFFMKEPIEISMFVHQYKMANNESIDKITTHFLHIINQLKTLGKLYSNVEMVRKIVISLPRVWQPNVTMIQKEKDPQHIIP